MDKQKDDSYLLDTPAKEQWRKIGIRPHHGINTPLFSLYTKKSCGIGEYLDFLPLIDWCSSVGMDTLQTLPLNDTGLEASPYGAISAFALNPIHIQLAALPHLENYPDLLDSINEAKKTIPVIKRVDYPKIRKEKEEILKKYFDREKENIRKNIAFTDFLNKNKSWLPSFALFKTIKGCQNNKAWEFWPENVKDYQQAIKNNQSYQQEMDWHIFVQYICFQQLSSVKRYADKKGILLKGDIPIMINRDSADVWQHPSLFNLNYSAGAPPDIYSSLGQNWEVPIYRWEEMEKKNFTWWKERLKVAENYYHLYRLDHVLGFFRFYAIPQGKSGKEGHYIPENLSQWLLLGKKNLSTILKSSFLFPIAEDLGDVRPEIRQCLKELGICGTKVIRWERFWDQPKAPFIPYDQYWPESMTTVSTHDSETLQQWWISSKEDAKEFSHFKGWTYTSSLEKKQQEDILWDSHHTSSLFHINLLGEYLALIPGMTANNPAEERINVPGIISEKNWTHRYTCSIEEIVENPALRDTIKRLTT